jgi:hypothetical protein
VIINAAGTPLAVLISPARSPGNARSGIHQPRSSGRIHGVNVFGMTVQNDF